MYTRLFLNVAVPRKGQSSVLGLCSPIHFRSRITVNRFDGFKIAQKEHHVMFNHQRYASTANHENLGREVYSGPLSKRIRSVKLFSLATSCCGLMIQPVMLQKILEEGTSIGVIVFSGAILQFFTFVTPVLLHFVTKKYVRAIYYQPETDNYTALTYNFWTADKLLTFKTEDVVVPDIPGMLTSIVVKGTPLFMEANYFSDLEHYKRIMGFDKPIDFKLYDDEKPGTGTKS